METFGKRLLKDIECNCGRIHKTDVKDIQIGEGALCRVPDLINKYGYQTIVLVADRNTFQAAGARVVDVCGEQGIRLIEYVWEEEPLVPNEEAIGQLITAIPFDCDLILAVGTGTINDLCRYVAFRMRIDYLIVATAPSMDGFASTVAPLIVNHMKKTFPAKAPIAIVGDASILKEAPMELIQAGVGDILGKYISLCDWRLSHMVTGEYYCEYLVDIVRESVRKMLDHMEGIPIRDENSITAVMEALVLSGIAMAYAGNSRPASGSEHHLAHYFEILFLLQNRNTVLHGTKVGVSTVIVRKLYDKWLCGRVDFNKAKRKAKEFNMDVWGKNVKAAYGEVLGKQVIKLEKEVGKNKTESVLARLERIQEIYPEIVKMVKEELPSTEKIIGIMETIRAPIRPQEIQVDKRMVVNGIRYAKDIRNRYGLFQLLFDLGYMDEAIDGWFDES